MGKNYDYGYNYAHYIVQRLSDNAFLEAWTDGRLTWGHVRRKALKFTAAETRYFRDNEKSLGCVIVDIKDKRVVR